MTPTLKWSRDNMRPETGPERAARRAARNGLTVGAPVRAEVMTKTPPGPQHELVPLEFGERLTNYRLQVAVRDHCLTGARWQPTARQYRRLERKARHAQAPFGPKNRPAQIQGRRVDMVILDDPPARLQLPPEAYTEPSGIEIPAAMRPERERSAMHRGFRVVDRRGEHRS